MIKNTYKQTGSAHVAIIAILIVALIGALGFIFWQKYTEKNAETRSTAQTATANQKDDSATSTQADRYTTLEDWGVKFKADDSLKATTIVQYKQKEQGKDGRDYYLINTERSEQAAKKNCPSLSDPTGLAVYRFQDKPAANSDGQLLELEGTLLNSAAVNGYYYVSTQLGFTCPGGQSTQASDNDIDSATEVGSIVASLRTIQSVK